MTRTKLGEHKKPDYLKIFKEKEKINSKQLMMHLNDKSYDLETEETNLIKL